MFPNNFYDLDLDVAIIGGGVAGLAAALTLGRAGRKTRVFTDGPPRNVGASAVHNFFSRDGVPVAELLRLATAQLEPYESVQLASTSVAEVRAVGAHFALRTQNGQQYTAQGIVLATGVRDELPPIPGLAALWGTKVLHCPYCHGWEHRHEAIALLANGEGVYAGLSLISNWNKEIVILTNGPVRLVPEKVSLLKQKGFDIIETAIKQVSDNPAGVIIEFDDGRQLVKGALYTRAYSRVFANGLASQLGCALHEGGAIQTNRFGQTSVPKVFAAGDVTQPSFHQVADAAASGARAAAGLNSQLSREAFEQYLRAE